MSDKITGFYVACDADGVDIVSILDVAIMDYRSRIDWVDRFRSKNCRFIHFETLKFTYDEKGGVNGIALK